MPRPRHPDWIDPRAGRRAPRLRLPAGSVAARDDDDLDRRDDDFDRPRAAKKKGSGALYAMIALGVLLVGGLIFALIYFLGGSDSYDSEMVAYLPAETNVMVGVEVEELMKNDKVKNMVTSFLQKDGKEFYDKLKEAGMSENDFTRVLVGGEFNPKGGGPGQDKFAVIIRAKKAFDKGKIAQVASLQEQEKNGKKYYKSTKEKDLFVYYPSDTLAVMVPSEKAIEGVMSRDGSKVAVSDEMQDLAKKLSKGHVWFAMSTAQFSNELGQVKNAKIPDVPSELTDAVAGMRGVGAYAKIDGDKVTFGGGILCADSSSATKAADALQKKIDEQRGKNLNENPLFKGKVDGVPPAFKSLIEDVQKSAKADSSGAMLEVSASFSFSGMEQLINSYFDLLRPVERHEFGPKDMPVMPKGPGKGIGMPPFPQPKGFPGPKEFGPPKDFPGFNPPKDFGKFPTIKDGASGLPKDAGKVKDAPKIERPKDLIPDFPGFPDLPKDLKRPDLKDAPKLPGEK